MKDIMLTCLILLGICAVGGWLYMMYACLRDAICPPRPWQRHWKWRLAAGTVFIVVLCGGLIAIFLLQMVYVGATQ